MRHIMHMLQTLWLLFILVLLAPQVLNAETAGPILSFTDETVRLSSNKSAEAVSTIVKAENLIKEGISSNETILVQDLGSPQPSDVIVEFPEPPVELARGASSRAWLIKVVVQKLPHNTIQKRYARLRFGQIEQTVAYTLTNVPAGSFTWSVQPLADWVIWHGLLRTDVTTTVVVTTGDVPATNLHIAQSSLKEQSMKTPLGVERLELCDTPTTTAPTCGSFAVDARTSRTLYLRLQPAHRQHGKFTGTLSFAVNERPELQTVNVTLFTSSWIAKLCGGIVMALGIGAAWWITVWARARMTRLQALKLVAALRKSLQDLKRELQNTLKIPGINLAETEQRLDDIDRTLTEDALDNASRLPPKTPNFLPTSTNAETNLQAYLTSLSAPLAGLTVIIWEGMRKLRERWNDALPQQDKDAIRKALEKLDQAGAVVKTQEEAQKAVQDAMKVYETERSKQETARVPAEPLPVPPPSLEHLNWELDTINMMGWFVWGGLTLVAGVALLLIMNLGFGTPMDFIFCFFWGFGLPITGDKLQQLNPGSIASSIGISLPKPPSP
jgi:hypothetical protein